METEIVIIGAGAAGIGFGVTLKELGISDFMILEKREIGQSFKQWPLETRFITPSFPSNGYGLPDLNAISVDTSPSFTLSKERVTGIEFADYLNRVKLAYSLPVKENQEVISISKNLTNFLIQTNQGIIHSKFVILAVGEFSFPNNETIKGGREHGIHYSEITSWKDLSGEEQVIVGGNESALDAAINLMNLGKKVRLITSQTALGKKGADPSQVLSPYTKERLSEVLHSGDKSEKIELIERAKIVEIHKKNNYFYLISQEGRVFKSQYKPILATGFKNGAQNVGGKLFSQTQTGEIDLTEKDESVITQNAFMIGPSLKIAEQSFCYIYKFRQRFSLIAEEILKRMAHSIDTSQLKYYQQHGFSSERAHNCTLNCDC